jgi:hypothetical protein
MILAPPLVAIAALHHFPLLPQAKALLLAMALALALALQGHGFIVLLLR